jgi:hypothetical protein
MAFLRRFQSALRMLINTVKTRRSLRNIKVELAVRATEGRRLRSVRFLITQPRLTRPTFYPQVHLSAPGFHPVPESPYRRISASHPGPGVRADSAWKSCRMDRFLHVPQRL